MVEFKSIDSATGIEISPERDNRLSDFSKKLIKDYYLRDNETIQEGFARAAFAWSSDNDHAQRLYDYVSKGWFMFASPVFSNAPKTLDHNKRIFEKSKGLPISCFAGYISDSLESLISHTSEVRWLSVMGGGVGSYWGKVRSSCKKSPGPIPFIHTMDADMEAYKQGSTRRGSYAAYMDVSHPDIVEFINLRVPTGDASRKCHSAGFHNAVNVTDDFMEAVLNDADWNLIDPNSKEVKDVVKARELWEQILDIRYRTGEPYLHFVDTSNRYLPQIQKDMGLRVNNSNLCAEIMLPTNEDRTFVCCLSSLNLEKFDEWKETSIIRDLIRMLDNIITYFVANAPDVIEKARYSAMRERALGLGVMGFHNLLQKNRIPFESLRAKNLNTNLFKFINDEAILETLKLGKEFGEAPDIQTTLLFNFGFEELEINSSEFIGNKRAFEYNVGDFIPSYGEIVSITGKHDYSGRRNTQLMALAPTANSAILCGTSPSIEPINSNAYIHQTRAGSWPIKNFYLEELLIEKNLNTDEVWKEIISSKGSIQHMDIFTDEEKEIFKTAIEINQMWVVEHAGDRQPYVSQGQSINLFFPPKCSRDYFNKVHVAAHTKGLKSLYYVRTTAPNRPDNVSKKIERIALKDGNESEECLSCQG